MFFTYLNNVSTLCCETKLFFCVKILMLKTERQHWATILGVPRLYWTGRLASKLNRPQSSGLDITAEMPHSEYMCLCSYRYSCMLGRLVGQLHGYIMVKWPGAWGMCGIGVSLVQGYVRNVLVILPHIVNFAILCWLPLMLMAHDSDVCCVHFVRCLWLTSYYCMCLLMKWHVD